LNYTRPAFLFTNHLETIYPALFRNVKLQPYTRERIQTPDDDFLDLDWLTQSANKLVIISHGLEGNTTRAYIKGMAKICFQHGYDVLTWNFRGCSEELNKKLHFYHSGATYDLATVVDHAKNKNQYSEINLIGFSLGGNLTLKYLGETRERPTELKKAITFSVPVDLGSSCKKISEPANWVYSKRFLTSLTKKVIQKSQVMPELDVKPLAKIKTLHEFDDAYTGPIHGFKNAADYYEKSSAIKYINAINISTLVVNALNDPFLSEACFPVDLLKNHSFVQLETPVHGGHVGFAHFKKNGVYWSEQRAINFLLH
jgi:predicted alpha/beta-fold hydrolase